MREDVAALCALGRALDTRPSALGGDSVAMALAEKLLRVRGRDGRLTPLRANAAQRAFEARRGQHNIVLKARQMGLSTWGVGRMLLRAVTREGAMTVLVAQNREAAETLFRIAGRMWENLPAAWREGPLQRSRANVGQMVFARLDSEFRVVSAADENAGRGLTITDLLCSEVSRWPGDAAATLAGLRAALVASGESLLESTANGAYGAFWREWEAAGEDVVGGNADSSAPLRNDKEDGGGLTLLRNDKGAVRHFLPWWMEAAYAGAAVREREWSAEERELVRRHGLTAEQVGFRRGLVARYGALRAQEFPEDAETCFRATGSCCFDAASLEARMAQLREPLERRRGGALLVWWPAVAGREYIVAADPAGGGADGDFAAVQVVDRATGVQCAELRERLDPLRLAEVVRALAAEFNGALVAVERNNHGAAVIAYLRTTWAYERLWVACDGQAGWLTTAASKPAMVSALGAVIAGRAELLESRRLLAECRTFVLGTDGRSGAASGAHDDLVMAMALALAVRSS